MWRHGTVGPTDKYNPDSYQGRFGVQILAYNISLGNKIQTTSVHKDDAGFLTGSTTNNLSSGTDFGMILGFEKELYSTEPHYFTLNGGVDFRVNILGLDRDSYQSGFYESIEQNSDTRPSYSCSMVFTQLSPNYYTIIPRIECLVEIFKDYFISVEIGAPYMEYRVTSGHDRWASWETVQEDTWNGFGLLYALRVGIREGGGNILLLGIRAEEYHPTFGGEKSRN